MQVRVVHHHLVAFLVLDTADTAYYTNIGRWSASATPPPTNGRINPTRKGTRSSRGSTLAPSQTQTPAPPARPSSNTPNPARSAAPSSAQAMAPPPPVGLRQLLPTTPQAFHSTYASRLRTGTTLLMQPILAPSSVTAVATRTSRRGGVINYTEPNSGDEFPDSGAIDSDDSDFVASGGTRQAVRNARLPSKAPVGSSVFHAGTGVERSAVTTPAVVVGQKAELDQSYLGQIPPSRFVSTRSIPPTKLEYQ